MLCDVPMLPEDGPSAVRMILRIVAAQNEVGEEGPAPKRIGTGLYLLRHWNLECEIDPRVKLDLYPRLGGDLSACGVCDSPKQFLRVYGPTLSGPKRKFFVGFVRLLRSEQPESGGWRWCKWGPYIGERKPQREYLHDEPEIDEVYTCHVYEIME